MEDKICDRISKLVMMFGEGKNTAFAARIGDSEANIRNYRSGRTTPKFNVLLSIINNLGVSSEWLMTGKGDIFADGHMSELDEPLRRAVPRGGGISCSKKWPPDEIYMGVPGTMQDFVEPSKQEDDDAKLERAKKIASELNARYKDYGKSAKKKDEESGLRADVDKCMSRIDDLSRSVDEIKAMLRALMSK